MNLSDEIEKCTRCLDIGIAGSSRLNTDQKPYVKFDVERKWRPSRVRVLFIAESPPRNRKQRYFYNSSADSKGGLREEVLRYLNMRSLEEFRDKGCYLIDAIKCRLNKSSQLKSPLRLNKIVEKCASQFLVREIEDLKSETVFVLGNTAKKALGSFPEFQELKKYRITEDYDQELNACRIILCVFPGGQTRLHTDKIKRAFDKIRS